MTMTVVEGMLMPCNEAQAGVPYAYPRLAALVYLNGNDADEREQHRTASIGSVDPALAWSPYPANSQTVSLIRRSIEDECFPLALSGTEWSAEPSPQDTG